MHASAPSGVRSHLLRASDTPLIIGLACMLSTNLINSVAVMPLLRFDALDTFMDTNARAYIWVFFIASLVMTAFVLARRLALRAHLSDATGRLIEKVVLVLGSLLYVVGSCCIAWMGVFGALPPAVRIVARASLGLGAFVAFLSWGRALRQFGLRSAITLVGLATIGSAGLSLLFMHAPGPVACVGFALCGVLAIGIPLPVSLATVDEAPAAALVDGRPRASRGVRSFLGVAALPFIGLLFFSIILALQAWRFGGQYHSYCLSEVLAALAAIALAAGLDTRLLMRAAYRGALPMAAVCAVAFTHVVQTLGADPVLGSLPAFLLYSLSILLGLSTLVGMANAREFPVDLIVSVACAIFAGVTLAGPWLLGCFSLQSNVQVIDAIATVLTALYAIVLVGLSVAQSLAAERSLAEGVLARTAAHATPDAQTGLQDAPQIPREAAAHAPSRQDISRACDRAAVATPISDSSSIMTPFVFIHKNGRLLIKP